MIVKEMVKRMKIKDMNEKTRKREKTKENKRKINCEIE